MSETTTAQQEDPSLEHADLLQELSGPRRDAVVESLRHSASSGWPASRPAVSGLVAYAQGRISSREYAVQIMVALGYADAQTAAALIAGRSQAPAPPISRFDASAGFDFLYER